mgnify:CR=1 FL=1
MMITAENLRDLADRCEADDPHSAARFRQAAETLEALADRLAVAVDDIHKLDDLYARDGIASEHARQIENIFDYHKERPL